MNCNRTYSAVYLFSSLLFSGVFAGSLVDNDDDKPLDNTTPEQNHLQSGFLVKTILQRTRGLPSSMTLMQYRPSSLQGFTEIDSSDLHTAYRLPIQRLSNTQLQLLLQKYEAQPPVQLTRTEMIEKLKSLISQKDKMLRPRLLTNVNVLNNPNAEMTLPNEPVVNLNELERTTLGSITLTSPRTDSNEEPEIRSLPILVDNEDQSSAIKQISQHEIRRSHKRLPDNSSILTSTGNDKQDVEDMRKKNNQLHSSYFESLSMDLERLKLKRINERNVQRQSNNVINASPTFIVSEKEDINHSEAVGDKSAEFEEKTTTIKYETTENAQEPIGGAKIEEEILANRKALLTTIEQPIEEVTPSPISNESKEDSQEDQSPDVNAFFNSANFETTTKNEEPNIPESNETSTESTAPTIDGREIVDNEPETQSDGPITTNDPSDHKSSGTLRIHTVNLNNIEGHSVENVSSEQQEESSTVKIITNQNVIPPLNVVEAMTNIESEIMNPTLWKQQATEAGMERKLKVMLTRVNETINPDELINQLKDEAVEKTIDAQTSDLLPVNVEDKLTVVTPKPRPQVCDPVSCNFEKGNFCRWKTSIDELNPTNRRNLHGNRKRRATEYVLRSFHIWSGRHQNDNFGIARSNFFSLNNTKFASSYLRPFERSTLSVDLTNLNDRSTIVQFHVWESVRNMQARVCCDSTRSCVYETNLGVLKGTRRWLKQRSSCPVGTKRLIFECVNHGKYQGACGIDEIKLLNNDCSPPLLDSDRLM